MISLEEQSKYREKMLADKPILLDKIGVIYTPQIKDILDISSSIYFEIVNSFCCTKYSFSNYEEIPNDFNAFDYVVSSCLKSKQFKKNCELVLSMILQQQIIFIEEYFCFLVQNNELENISYINKDNFILLQEIIRLQNGIKKPKIKANRSQKVIELEKKSEAGRMLLAKAKGMNIRLETEVFNMGVFLQDLQKALDLNIYQFNNQYMKFMKFQEYQEQIKALLAGADKKDINLKGHWTSELN